MASLAGAPTTGHASSPMSSPPHSPPRHSSLYPPAPSYGPANNSQFQYGPLDKNPPSSHEHVSVQSVIGSSANDTDTAAAKPKQRRKKATADGTSPATTDGKADPETKVKRTRKPRDPNAAPPKKRVKKEDKQTTIPASLAMEPVTGSAPYPSLSNATSAANVAQTGNSDTKELPKAYPPNSEQFRAPARPASSGQRYDPVRGTSVEIPVDRSPSSSAYGPVSVKSPVRTAPSIASLVDPSPPPPPPGAPNYQPRSTPASAYGPASTPNGASSSHTSKLSSSSHPSALDGTSANESLPVAKTVDTPPRRPSPKAPKSKDIAPPPLPGSGLPPLTNADFGRPSNKERKYEDVPNDCIVIDVPMNPGGGGGSYVNFLKEVENKYGFDVAHPRLAEHRRRMKEIAVAGAALESGPGSADEMNLDVSEGESDVEMGEKGEGSNSEGAKRKRRVNEKYDLDDEFIDDSEMIWTEQALASRDGYFVWSGPLIQEGDKPTIERADGTVKRGGRGGRGGARGGTSRGDGTGKTRGTRGGGGPGSRGGTTVRKPRVTKADRAKMESEKVERERMAATAAKPTLYPGTVS